MKVIEIFFKPIPNYEGYYEISNTGIVRGVERFIPIGNPSNNKRRKIKAKIIKTTTNNWGYVEVRLSRENKSKTTFIHTLVAETFIPNPANKLEVNHKNGCKTCNQIENLEWVTHKENMRHAVNNGLIRPKGRAVFDHCIKILFINTREAARFHGINQNTLRGYLSGQIKNNPTCLRYH